MFEVLFFEKKINSNFEDEDLKIINICKEGSKENFELLVKKYQKNVINFIYRIIQNFEDSLDIAQEVFIRAYFNIKKFKGKSKFSTWLYSIALNLSRNYLKKKKVSEKILKNDLNIQKNDPLPLGEMEREELKEKIKRCLSCMDKELKEVIILRDLEGFSYEEISAILKIPEGTVKSRLFRAREKFIKIFEKFGEI